MLNDVVIAGIGETKKSRARTERGEEYMSLTEYFTAAQQLTLADAGFSKNDVDGFGIVEPNVGLVGRHPSKIGEILGLGDLEYLTYANHGGSSAAELLLQSALAVDAGLIDSILCLGADTPVAPTRSEGGFWQSRQQDTPEAQWFDPFGNQGPSTRLAPLVKEYVERYDVAPETRGKIAIAQRQQAMRNPLAYFDEELTMEEYLNAPRIADPIRLYDCVIPVNAGFGFLLTNTDTAASLDTEPVSIEGFGRRMNPELVERPDPTTLGNEAAATEAFDRADVGPWDADLYQIYDDYPTLVLMQLDALGLGEHGDAPELIKESDIAFDGNLPINTGGGQLSSGQAGRCGGMTQMLEAVRQLRRDATDRQVPDAERAVLSTIGGGPDYHKNVANSCVTVLRRGA